MLIYERAKEIADGDTVVLNVGTKAGRRASDIPGTVYALNIDPKPSVTSMSYLQADGSRLPFDNDTFDIVVSNQVLEHVPFERKAAFVQEIARSLRPGGTFLMSFPNRLLQKTPTASYCSFHTSPSRLDRG